jgi:hypothetical protein
VQDLDEWVSATHRQVGSRKEEERDPFKVCKLMFGNLTLKGTDKGWPKSTGRYCFDKVSAILAVMGSAFSRRGTSSRNPFLMNEFKKVIAKCAAAGKGFVWHTIPSNQHRMIGKIVPVQPVRNNLQSAVSSGLGGQQTDRRTDHPERYHRPTNHFDDYFLSSSGKIQTLKIFEIRACVQALIGYMKENGHFPMQKREIQLFNQASVKLFDVFMEIEAHRTFRCPDHWKNLWKKHNVRRLFMAVRTIEEAEGINDFWKKVFQITDRSTRHRMNKILTAINSDGQLSVIDDDFEWPTIDMGEAEEAEDETDEPTNRDTDNWSTEVCSLFHTTVWKSSVKHQLIGIHATWHERLEAMRFVKEGQEQIFSRDLWNALHAFTYATTNHQRRDWENPACLQNYLFNNKIVVSA